MAEKDELNDVESVAASEQRTPIRASLLGRISVLLILAALVAMECVVAYVFMPGPEVYANIARTNAAGGEAQDPRGDLGGDMPPDPEDQDDIDIGPDVTEVDLGEFTVSTYLDGTNTTLRFRFHLYGLVADDDLEDFEAEYEKKTRRIREQIFKIIKESELEDIKDPSLSLIKRRILTTINKAFRRKVVKSVMMDDVSDTQI
jgi:hypothetical protein